MKIRGGGQRFLIVALSGLLAGCSTTTLDEDLVMAAAAAMAAELCKIQADPMALPEAPE